MKKFLSVLTVGILLLSNCNLMYAQYNSSGEEFNNYWEMITPSMSENGVFFDGGQLSECSQFPNTERGCVKYANKQEAGDFVESNVDVDFSPKNVQVRKMVLPTNNPGEFEIALYVRGKSSQQQTSSDKKICSVVVFDKSGSMGLKSSGDSSNPGNGGGDSYTDDPTHGGSSTIPLNNITYYATGEKWLSAVSGAVLFSDIILNRFQNSNVGLVFFGEAGSIKEPLGDTPFPYSTFDLGTLDTSTNIHAGLIQAKYAFEDEDCDKKYIVLMSDGFANAYMWYGTTPTTVQGESGYVLASNETIEYASGLKNRDGIEIFSIGYELSSSIYSGLARNTLQQIASDELHYFDADVDNISNIFSKISEDQIVFFDPRVTSIIDSLGNKILGSKINITEETSITESGVVYPFPIRIDPTASGWVDTNNGLTMNYINSEGNPDSLVISASKSSQIYWEQPKCGGSYPSGNGVFTGKGEFTQNWVTPTPQDRGKDESENNSTDHLVLSPEFMDWHYTDSENPGECEWTCTPGYHKQSEGCEKDTYTVTFNPTDGTGTMEPQVINNGEATHLSKNTFTLTGYTFSGWNTSAKRNGTGYADEEEVTDLVGAGGSITLYARWTPNPYTIEFNENGGDGTMSGQNMIYDTPANLHKNTYTRNGFIFSGWNTEPDGSGTPYIDEESVNKLATTGTVTLYAQWTAIANTTYEVTFNPTIGTGTMEPQVINSNEATKLSKNTFTLTGYTFSGWNTSAKRNGTGYADEEEVTDLVGAGGSITLYARWTPNPYTIEFNANGGDGTMSDQNMIYDTPANLHKSTYTRNGFIFSGWNTKADGTGTPYSDEASVDKLATTGTITLYAQWTAIANTTYTVIFDANGGTGTMSAQNINSNEAAHLSKNTFTRAGYTFSGWNADKNGHGTGYADEEEVTDLAGAGGSITLYARWTPNPYTIKFDPNEGTGTMEDQDMIYGTYDYLKKNKYTRDGYTFKGWNTKPNGSGTPYANGAHVRNLTTTGTATLYAQRGKNNTGGGGSGGGGGGGKITKDDCPDGDYSGNFYDRKCGSKVNTGKTEEEPEENQVKPTPIEYKTDTKKCSIEGSKHSAEVNEAYIWACQNGIIKSQTIQGARLGEFLNRAEMAKIITVFEMLILDSKPNRSKDCSAFADSISGYNEEMKNYMITSCQLERMGIHTADHKPIKDFMPKKFVSRAEFGTILSRTLWGNKYEANKNSANYYVDHLTTLKGGEILSNINPELKERRSYAILMIYRAAKYLGKA